MADADADDGGDNRRSVTMSTMLHDQFGCSTHAADANVQPPLQLLQCIENTALE